MGYEFRFDIILEYLSFLLQGLKITLLVSISAFVIATIVGMLVAVLRLTKLRALEILLSLYVDVLRSIPQLVLLFWFFYAIPLLSGYQISAILSATIALAILTSASLSEIFRSGILSVDKGQWDAAFAIGMTQLQAYRRVILPQAITRMLPPIVSMSISMVKASALVSAVGVVDLMWQGNALVVLTMRRIEVYTIIAIIYFLLTYPQALIVNRLHKRLVKAR